MTIFTKQKQSWNAAVAFGIVINHVYIQFVIRIIVIIDYKSHHSTSFTFNALCKERTSTKDIIISEIQIFILLNTLFQQAQCYSLIIICSVIRCKHRLVRQSLTQYVNIFPS